MTTAPTRLLGLLGLVLAVIQPFHALGQGVEVDTRDLEQWSQGSLASSFDAISANLLYDPAILAPQLELAFGLALVATELDPASESAWRRLLEVSTALEADLPEAVGARRSAIEALVKLDPDDSVMRLRLLLDRIEERPTAQARVAAYEILLSPENLKRLGNKAGSRLAFDLALLQQRIGNLDAAAQRIAQAVGLDPSFPQAADMAAGLFRSVVPTPIDEAELLAIAFTASPGDDVIAKSLADLTLAAGAYGHADDLLELASLLQPARSPKMEMLAADRILAMWGARRLDDARAFGVSTNRTRTRTVKQQLLRDGIAPGEVEKMVVPPSPDVALVLAVIEARNGDRMQREKAVSRLFASYRFRLTELTRARERLNEQPSLEDDELEARREQRQKSMLAGISKVEAGIYADQAWARAWFGWAPPTAQDDPDASEDEKQSASRLSLDDLLKGALRGGAIDASQEQVVRGWAAMEEENFDLARSLLTPASESSPYAEAGVALLDEVAGDRQQAARKYLAVYNARPGSLVGLWCRSRLEALLETEVPVPPQADLMADMLRSTLPEAVGRVIRDPRHGLLALEIEPVSPRTSAFEPLVVTITLTNVSDLDLAIGPNSPIGPTLAIVPDVVEIVGLPSIPTINRQSKPTILAIDRRFSLESQESIRFTVDLSGTLLANDIAKASIFGGSFKLRAVVNYTVASSMNIDAARFGREATTPVFRVDGIDPFKDGRMAGIMEEMKQARTIGDTKDIAMMLQLVMEPPGGQALLTDDASRLATVEACLALPPVARAWAASLLLPGSSGIIRIVDRLVADGSRASMVLALSQFSATPTASPIVAGLKSNDPLIRRLAEASRQLAEFKQLKKDKSLLDYDEDQVTSQR